MARCRCGKYDLEGDEPFISNRVQHESINQSDGFCGNYEHHKLRDLEKLLSVANAKLAKIRAAVERCQQNDSDGMPVTMAAEQLYIELCGIFEMPF